MHTHLLGNTSNKNNLNSHKMRVEGSYEVKTGPYGVKVGGGGQRGGWRHL